MKIHSLLGSFPRLTVSRKMKSKPPRKGCSRRLRVEGLEERTALSATPGAVEADSIIACPLEEVDVAIQQVVLSINGSERVIQQLESTLVVSEGDTIELREVNYRVNAVPSSCNAVIAGEAYFRKGTAFDYSDGRFGDSRGSDPFTNIDMALAMNGNWQVGTDWDRMSVPLLGYAENESEVYDRFFINFQVVDDRDLGLSLSDTFNALRMESFFVDREATLQGTWINYGSAQETAEMEVRVFSAANLTAPVWTGQFSAIAPAGDRVSGTFVDANGESWAPTDTGLHLLSFRVDPDNVIHELREWNNWAFLPIRVS